MRVLILTTYSCTLVYCSNLWLKIQNPFILYQDSSLTLHIISLLSFAKVASLLLLGKITSFAMVNEENLIFLLENGDFVHFNSREVST